MLVTVEKCKYVCAKHCLVLCEVVLSKSKQEQDRIYVWTTQTCKFSPLRAPAEVSLIQVSENDSISVITMSESQGGENFLLDCVLEERIGTEAIQPLLGSQMNPRNTFCIKRPKLFLLIFWFFGSLELSLRPQEYILYQ